MALSYSLRLVCLIVAGMGLMQTSFEVLFWACGRAVLRLLRGLPLRQQERALYAVQILPFLLATLLTGLCWVPRYVSTETNFAAEEVGRICLLLSIVVAVRWGVSVLSGARMVVRTVVFARGLLEMSRIKGPDAGRIPVVAVSGAVPRVVLVGLFRPFILISRSLTEEGGLDPLALDVVLEHERSHAAQMDNWKLFSLHCLPRLRLRVSGGKTWMQLWQSATERAADEDAARGSSERALRLAETLVALARSRSVVQTHLAWTHFVCAGTELASRVDQLTQSFESVPARAKPALVWVSGVAAVAGAVAMVSLAGLSAGLPEFVLHLG